MWPRAPESFMENSLHMEKSCISQYSIISPLESPQDSPEALLEGLQSLKVGPILVIFLLTKQIRNLHMYVSTCLNIGRWWRDDGCACFCFPSARHRMLRYVSWPEAVRIVGFTELVEGLQSCNCQLTDASQEPHRTPHRSLTGASQELLSICSMYYVWVRSCMCGDPSRAGTQNCPEVWGPRIEMRRKPRYHEVGISHKKTSQLRGSVVCIVQALFLRRRISVQDIKATLYIMAGGRIASLATRSVS